MRVEIEISKRNLGNNAIGHKKSMAEEAHWAIDIDGRAAIKRYPRSKLEYFELLRIDTLLFPVNRCYGAHTTSARIVYVQINPLPLSMT